MRSRAQLLLFLRARATCTCAISSGVSSLSAFYKKGSPLQANDHGERRAPAAAMMMQLAPLWRSAALLVLALPLCGSLQMYRVLGVRDSTKYECNGCASGRAMPPPRRRRHDAAAPPRPPPPLTPVRSQAATSSGRGTPSWTATRSRISSCRTRALTSRRRSNPGSAPEEEGAQDVAANLGLLRGRGQVKGAVAAAERAEVLVERGGLLHRRHRALRRRRGRPERRAGVRRQLGVQREKRPVLKCSEGKVNCAGGYGSWGARSKMCGAGTQRASYKVATVASGGGSACAVKAGSTKSRACTVKACPVDCAGSYGSWGACSRTCGAGKQTAAYKVVTAAANSGKPCVPAGGPYRRPTVRAASGGSRDSRYRRPIREI